MGEDLEMFGGGDDDAVNAGGGPRVRTVRRRSGPDPNRRRGRGLRFSRGFMRISFNSPVKFQISRKSPGVNERKAARKRGAACY